MTSFTVEFSNVGTMHLYVSTECRVHGGTQCSKLDPLPWRHLARLHTLPYVIILGGEGYLARLGSTRIMY